MRLTGLVSVDSEKGKTLMRLTNLDSLDSEERKTLMINKYFQEVLTVKSFKHCMFKLALQIGLYDQNLVREKKT